jgi:hypothetical protein
MIRIVKNKKNILSRTLLFKRRLSALKRKRKIEFTDEKLLNPVELSSTLFLSEDYSSEEDVAAITDNIQPVIDVYTENAIQKIIKQRITKDSLKRFYAKKITRSNIDQYRKLFEVNRYESVEESKRKYLHDLAVAVVYEELLSISELDDVLLNNPDAVSILERMIVLEYELYTLEYVIEDTTELKDKVYIVDNIPTLFYNFNGAPSYRNYNNLSDEVNAVSASVDISSIIDEDSDFEPIGIVRVNEEEAYIETTNSPLYSLILNYTPLNGIRDQRLTRMYYALTQEAYYTKKILKNDGTESTEVVVLVDEDIDLKDYSFYGLLVNRVVNDSDLKNANEALKNLWNKILNGTINY